MLRGVMESAMDVEVERGPRIFKPDVRTQRNNVSTPNERLSARALREHAI